MTRPPLRYRVRATVLMTSKAGDFTSVSYTNDDGGTSFLPPGEYLATDTTTGFFDYETGQIFHATVDEGPFKGAKVAFRGASIRERITA